MQHSKIVGGSTAKRVINCPGSVALVNQMPPQPSSKYADEGTLLHDTIADILDGKGTAASFIGRTHGEIVLTEELIERKLTPALEALDEIDPKGTMEYEVESRVGFGALLPDVFGSTDFLGRDGDRAVVLDWKFGDGVPVSPEENHQLLFYAAAAMRTPSSEWVFDGAKEIELVIVQPPSIKRWTTTAARIRDFENQLVAAVDIALKPDAPLALGDHCRWCAAKPICPLLTGAVDRALKAKVDVMPVEQIAHYLDQAPILEQWIADLRQLAHGLIEEGKDVPRWKLVNKRATRQWVSEERAVAYLASVGVEAWGEPKPVSPAQAEKALKKAKLELPEDLVVSVSTGSTLAAESDPRPSVLQIGHTLKKAMAKLQ